jgi:hypothetical protein
VFTVTMREQRPSTLQSFGSTSAVQKGADEYGPSIQSNPLAVCLAVYFCFAMTRRVFASRMSETTAVTPAHSESDSLKHATLGCLLQILGSQGGRNRRRQHFAPCAFPPLPPLTADSSFPSPRFFTPLLAIPLLCRPRVHCKPVL